ncbi:unnamed protein product [Paramecium octaurelia]|uniref:Uncharacterized protein n=1 Tax=Paramecium octaurelia TaxID=43137 RepID=A0A8S1XPP6_PAROT|nr:unnamed protein product [Paramecium octaurelia]
MMKQEQDKSIWEWVPCNYDVKRIVKDTQTSWNLSPQISLKIPAENGTIDPIINIKIDQSRPFIYSDNLGWNWHKSWNLPDIGLEMEITDPQTNERLAPPNNIYCKLQIVKPIITPMKTHHLLEVGAKGNLKVDMENGKCIFSGLKFNTTSYNHDHQRFHIVITLYLCQSKFEFPQILDSRISPPIFVDSRKSARDIVKQKIQKLQSYFDPFLPNNLEKQFLIIKPSNQEVIKNSIEGLINYFTAPNIRHKVKHPIFLLLKFSACISLYVNSAKIKFTEPDNLIQTLQHVLSTSNALQGIQKIDQKLIILYIDCKANETKSQQNMKKILEFLEPLNNDCVQVIMDINDVPKGFMLIENLDEMQQAYHRVYNSLLKYKREDDQIDQEQLEEEYNAKIPEKKKKKELKEPEQLVNPERIRKIIHISGTLPNQSSNSMPEQESNQVKMEQQFSIPNNVQLRLPNQEQSQQYLQQSQLQQQQLQQNLAYNPMSLWLYLQKLPS